MSNRIAAHFIDEQSGKRLLNITIDYCPRVGDEIRIAENTYHTIKRVVWVYDEPESPRQRVNIGTERVNDDQ